uniref:Uncharacterized protein n=1 Tax=Moniliophthora roreri TaxID=221103 RepID=A0A0W0F3I8_MONRR
MCPVFSYRNGFCYPGDFSLHLPLLSSYCPV